MTGILPMRFYVYKGRRTNNSLTAFLKVICKTKTFRADVVPKYLESDEILINVCSKQKNLNIQSVNRKDIKLGIKILFYI